jgi:hypothetical protein
VSTWTRGHDANDANDANDPNVQAVNPLPFGDSNLPLQFKPPCGDDDASRKDDSGDCSGRSLKAAHLEICFLVKIALLSQKLAMHFSLYCTVSSGL